MSAHSNLTNLKTRGFGLLEAIMAIGVLAVATVGMLTLVQSMAAVQTIGEIRNEVINQVYDLRVALTNPDVCRANLGGISLTAGTTAVGKKLYALETGSTTALDMTQPLLPAPLSGARVFASEFRLLQTAIPNLYDLQIRFENETRAGHADYFRRIPLQVTLTAGVITECTAGIGTGGGGDMAAICSKLGGLYDSTSENCDILSPACARFGGTFNFVTKTCAIAGTTPTGNLADCLHPSSGLMVPSGQTRTEGGLGCDGSTTYLCVGGTWAIIGQVGSSCSN